MWDKILSNTPLLLIVLIMVIPILIGLVKFIDVWQIKPRRLTEEDRLDGELPMIFEGLGSRLLLYTGVDWGLLIIEHYGLWRRWHGAPGRQKMKFTLASRLLLPWGVLPGMLCLERAKDRGRLSNLGEVNAIFFTRGQEESFRQAEKLIHEYNTKLDRKQPLKPNGAKAGVASDDTGGTVV